LSGICQHFFREMKARWVIIALENHRLRPETSRPPWKNLT
jgi:hypothetical protein